VSPMRRLFAALANCNCQSGQGQVEYGLILMLIAITVLATLLLLGQTVNDMYHNVSHAIPH